jgi:hypothetical protein|tara:strand:+ start:790 stop:1152 length:363 start_codon:yes stop_codon:yes gene_type:complete
MHSIIAAIDADISDLLQHKAHGHSVLPDLVEAYLSRAIESAKLVALSESYAGTLARNLEGELDELAAMTDLPFVADAVDSILRTTMVAILSEAGRSASTHALAMREALEAASRYASPIAA